MNAFIENTYKIEKLDISNLTLNDDTNYNGFIVSSNVKVIKCKEDTFNRLLTGHEFFESFIQFGDIYVDSTYRTNEQNDIKPLTSYSKKKPLIHLIVVTCKWVS